MDLDDDSGLSSLSELEATPEPEPQRRRSGRQPKPRNAADETTQDSIVSGLPKRRPQKGKQAATKGRRAAGSTEEPDIPVPSASQLDGSNNREEVDEEEDEEEDSDEVDSDNENDEDFAGPTSRSKGGKKRGPTRTKPARTGTSKRSSKPARKQKGDGEDGGDGEDAEAEAAKARGKDDFNIQPDNELFNAVRDPKSAVEANVGEWIEQYQSDEDSRGQALAELVNFILRTCGCNISVDRHEAQDLDGVVDKLDDIQAEFAKVNQMLYPLISKSKTYKKFRESLAEFMDKLINATAESEILYDDVFCETLQTWLVAGSTSKLRAFRHTSTVIVLLLVDALCPVATEVQRKLQSLQRQKETEAKKARSKTDKSRLKSLENNVKSTHSQKMKLETYFKDLFEAVFVLRYRDSEPLIRTECIRALGGWMEKHPDYFLEGNYLRYIGWMLTDLNKDVRHEAVRSLATLYPKEDYINSMNHFTERFKARLVEMATSDYEAPVRVSAVQVLVEIDKHGLLEDEQRDEIGRLVFDTEARVRKAVGPFFSMLLSEAVEELQKEAETNADRLDSNDTEHDHAKKLDQLNLKCLAELLNKFGEQLDSLAPAVHESNEEEDDDAMPLNGDQGSVSTRRKDVLQQLQQKNKSQISAIQSAAILEKQRKGRIAAAVESLWSSLEMVQDWEKIVDFLLLDHSSGEDGAAQRDTAAPPKRTTVGEGEGEEALPAPGESEKVDTDCKLTDDEETVLLSVLVSSITLTKLRASLMSAKDEAGKDEIINSLTRKLMTSLPRLIAKHQTDANRLWMVLALPLQMNLELYLDLRRVSSYEVLWDDLIKQFCQHSDLNLLERCLEAIVYMVSTAALSQTNTEKRINLEAAVKQPLVDIARDEEIERAELDDAAVEACTNATVKLALMIKSWDITKLLDEKEESETITPLRIIEGIEDRAQFGYAQEEKMVQSSLEILYYYFLRRVMQVPSEGYTPHSLAQLRTTIIERCTDASIRGQDISEVTDGVRRSAFKTLLDMHIVCQARYRMSDDLSDKVELSIEAQYKCAGLMRAEIERYAAETTAHSSEEDDIINESDAESGEEADGGNRTVNKKRNRAGEPKAVTFGRQPRSLAQLAAEYNFHDLVAAFTRAICTGILDLSHSSTLLIHHDRFGPFFDEACKQLGEALRHYGIYGEDGHSAASVVVDSLQGAMELYLKSTSYAEDTFVSLARLLSNHIVVRGRGFAIAKRLPTADLTKIHFDCVSWVAKKITTFESQERNASRNKALTIFKALPLFLLGAIGKEAKSIHTHMDKTFKDAGITPSSTSQYWEPQRSYERKLVLLMSKDTTIRAAARKAADAAQTEDEAGAGGSDAEVEESAVPARKRPRAKPTAARKAASKAVTQKEGSEIERLPSRRSGRVSAMGATSNYADVSSEEDEEEAEQTTPRKKARTAGAGGAPTEIESDGLRSPVPSQDMASSVEEDEAGTSEGAPSEDMRTTSPSASQLRNRQSTPRSRNATPMQGAVNGTMSTPRRTSPLKTSIVAPSPSMSLPSEDMNSPEPFREEEEEDSLAGVPDSPPQ